MIELDGFLEALDQLREANERNAKLQAVVEAAEALLKDARDTTLPDGERGYFASTVDWVAIERAIAALKGDKDGK